MGKAIGGSLPLAVGIALSPIPIIAVVLMLTSREPSPASSASRSVPGTPRCSNRCAESCAALPGTSITGRKCGVS